MPWPFGSFSLSENSSTDSYAAGLWVKALLPDDMVSVTIFSNVRSRLPFPQISPGEILELIFKRSNRGSIPERWIHPQSFDFWVYHKYS